VDRAGHSGTEPPNWPGARCRSNRVLQQGEHPAFPNRSRARRPRPARRAPGPQRAHGHAAYRQAADHELEEYTEELSGIVAGAYGDAQGDRFQEVREEPVEKLRAAFAMLLGEHMQLIIDAQRATFAGAPEFKAAAAQVNANTEALTRALGALVGRKKAAEFQSAWGRARRGPARLLRRPGQPGRRRAGGRPAGTGPAGTPKAPAPATPSPSSGPTAPPSASP
jgi:hypothetical protein